MALGIAQLMKNSPAMLEILVQFLAWEDPWRRDRLPTSVFLGFPGDSDGKEFTCNAGDLDLIPGLERSSGEGKGLPAPVFWPGEFHGLYSPWGHKESDMTERLSLCVYTKPWQGYASCLRSAQEAAVRVPSCLTWCVLPCPLSATPVLS